MKKAEIIQPGFDYASLDEATRKLAQDRAERIHNLARMTAAGIVQIGQYLTEVKAKLVHGKFLKWIKLEFAWKESSALRFMTVYQRFKSSKLENLAIDVSALYLIADQKTPEPVRDLVLRHAETGKRISHGSVRQLVRDFAETGTLPDVDVDLDATIRQKRQRALAEAPKPDEQEEEVQALRQRMAADSAHAVAIMKAIHAVETLAHPPITVAELAEQIARFDTPDKDWRGQARVAAHNIHQLLQEFSERKTA